MSKTTDGVTERSLQQFSDWMVKRGRSPDTAYQYVSRIRQCAADDRGITSRLTAAGLAPKSRRQNLASLRAWARFAGDQALRDQLDDLKLPPPERVLEKKPLSEDQWSEMIAAIDQVTMSDVKRAAIEMICVRGFRVGDVCRLTRSAIMQALETGVLIYPGKSGRQLQWESAPFEHCLRVFVAQGRFGEVRDLISPRAAKDKRQQASRLALQRIFPRVAKVAGVTDACGPHRMRRTYATGYLKETGGQIVDLQKHMGWASIATAQAYVDHSQRQQLDEVAERMRRRVRGKKLID